ncbi:YihY/virulence factor BrkB family protein [Noviherbaspirillum sedimenti]|uniref:YihY family inner membrane protein n=1 Tax=Noviherbaspirillum sedimenti TaxID=2320865 RepID=A0A3A3G549_9BURK|nr:YhjD/YihY/BrkB family envelope integrity protein [Noviherbaspirillum sedimenti]RJG02954.1 YihY family inner membrane protein [Noviherbaspirillum sedimenti]
MHLLDEKAAQILKHPGAFVLQALKSFIANNGLLLAGAVAYYALLSLVPLLILIVIVLSHIVDQAELLQTAGHYLEWLVPSQSKAVIHELSNFLENRSVIGWALLGTILFFSSLAFSVLNQAMSVIFYHRFLKQRRHFLISALLPYSAILVLGVGLLMLTVLAHGVELLGEQELVVAGRHWSLVGVSGFLLYLLGLGGEILMLTLIYWIMPVGRLSLRHALIGGVTAALLWEVARHLLVWYFVHLSHASVVYGALTTAVVVMLSFELAATLLLFGAQVIAQYELMTGVDADARAMEGKT